MENKIVLMPQSQIDKIPKGEADPLLGIRVFPVAEELCKRTVQVKTHKRKRINKKWLKRYGTKEEEFLYLINPDIFKIPPLKSMFLHEQQEKDKTDFKVICHWGM